MKKPEMQSIEASSPPVSLLRRTLLLAGIITLSGCSSGGRRTPPEPTKPLSAEDAQLKRKFLGLRGGQLRVDSLFRVRGLNIFDEHGRLFFAMAAMTAPGQRQLRRRFRRPEIPAF